MTEEGTKSMDRKRLDSEVYDEEEDDSLPTPPDGGYGWVIVFASFMIHVIADGVAYSFGIFLVEFVRYFDVGRAETSWLGSLMIGITWGCGPIASGLTNKFGCRAVTMGGGFLASFGFILSMFAPNLYFLYFSFGVISGLGLGLIYVPAIVSVTFYFEKRRSFATGLAVCGSGLGTFIFAPITQLLIDAYGSWKWAVLIEAGLILNCVVCGALLRPLLKGKKKKTRPLAECGEETTETLMDKSTVDANGSVKPNGATKFLEESKKKSTSTHSLSHNDEKSPGAYFNSDYNIAKVRQRHATDAKEPSAKHVHEAGPIDRKDAFYTASLQNIPLYKSNKELYNQSMASIPRAVRDESGTPTKKAKQPKMSNCRKILDYEVLLDPVFFIFCISNFLTSLGFCVPYMFLPDRAQLLGISPEKASMLIACIGIANTVGRIVFGWIGDRKCVNRLMLYNTVLTLCGVATMLSAACYTFETLALYSCSFGLFLGVYVSLTSVVLVDLMGLERLTSAFGMVLLFQGTAAVIGPPIAGWMFDITGMYEYPFFLFGLLIALSGIMLYPIPCIQRWQANKKSVAENEHDIDMGKKMPREVAMPINEMEVTA